MALPGLRIKQLMGCVEWSAIYLPLPSKNDNTTYRHFFVITSKYLIITNTI